jgi:hypothetical protein
MDKSKLAAFAILATIFIFPSTANAAPASQNLAAAMGEVGSLQLVHARSYRHCHWSHGRRWCHGGYGRYRGPGWGWGWGHRRYRHWR